MQKINPKDNYVYFPRGYANRMKGKTKIPVEKMIYTDPDCGYYVHPDGYAILPNFNPVSGDIDGKVALLVVDGSITVMTVAEANDLVCTYRNNEAVTATSVTISGCLTGTDLEIGATRQLTATVLPSGAVQTGTWTTSGAGVATVSSTGLVTGVSEGGVTITFTSTDGGLTATCVINVVEV